MAWIAYCLVEAAFERLREHGNKPSLLMMVVSQAGAFFNAAIVSLRQVSISINSASASPSRHSNMVPRLSKADANAPLDVGSGRSEAALPRAAIFASFVRSGLRTLSCTEVASEHIDSCR